MSTMLSVHISLAYLACGWMDAVQERSHPATTPSVRTIAPFDVLRPMQVEELPRIGMILGLSVAQERFLMHAHEEYFEASDSFRSESLEILRDDAILLGTMMSQQEFTDEFAERMRSFYHAQEQINHRLLGYEIDLFLQVESILTNEQRIMMPAGRSSRQRARYPVRAPSVPAANVDLVVMVTGLQLSDGIPAAVFDQLRRYEAEIAPLRKQRHESWLRRRIENALFVAQHSMSDPDAVEIRKRIFRPVVRIDERLRTANLSYLNSLLGEMTSEDAMLLQDQFDRTVHPDFYPDPGCLAIKALARPLLDTGDLSDEQQSVVAQLLEDYAAQYDRLRQRIDQLVLDQMREFSLSLMTHAERERAYADEVDVFLADRAALNQRYLELLGDIVESIDSE
jgi:hypothetical protein